MGADTETLVNYAQRHFKARHRQSEWLTVRAMVWQMLGPDAQITYDDLGRPRLDGSDLTISISHSKTHAVVALSRLPHLGVDIERMSPRILPLRQRIARADELPADFDEYPPERQIRLLTMLWTIKEAVYKCLPDQELDMLTDIQAPRLADTEQPRTAHVMPANMDVTIETCCLADQIMTLAGYADKEITQQQP